MSDYSLCQDNDFIADDISDNSDAMDFENETNEQHAERITANISPLTDIISDKILELISIDNFENFQKSIPDYVDNFNINTYTQDILRDMSVLTTNINKTDNMLKTFYINSSKIEKLHENFDKSINCFEVGEIINEEASHLLQHQYHIHKQITDFHDIYQNTPFILKDIYMKNSQILKIKLNNLIKLSSIDETTKYLISSDENSDPKNYLFHGGHLLGFIHERVTNLPLFRTEEIKGIVQQGIGYRPQYELRYIAPNGEIISFNSDMNIILDRTGEYLYGIKQENSVYIPITNIDNKLIKIKYINGSFFDFRYNNGNRIEYATL